MAATKPPGGGVAAPATGRLLIDDRFQILPGTPAPGLAGLPGFAAEDQHNAGAKVLALRCDAAAPPRARLPMFVQTQHECLLPALGHGVAGPAYWIIMAAPAGPSLGALSVPWGGNALLTNVLRPLATALQQLEEAGLTHRAIRPDNVFLSSGSKGVMLGPAFAAPPAFHQPVMFEPPYSGVCAPAARGDGSVADDVYALGVLLLALWTGTVPLADTDAGEVIRLKLEYGSYAALTRELRLQRGFEDILRAMLSDDPQSRPTPAALANLDGIHGHRGGQRPPARAPRPLPIGDELAWNRRTLGLLCAQQPAQAAQLLHSGALERWLRRSIEDSASASVLEELRREEQLEAAASSARAEVPARPSDTRLSDTRLSDTRLSDTGLMRLVALLDPLAPLFWRGCWLWPDGLGAMLAGVVVQPSSPTPQEAAALIEQLLERGGIRRWRALRPGRPEPIAPAVPHRLIRAAAQDDQQIFLARLAYGLNPYLGCASPKLAAEFAAHPRAVLIALERLAGTSPPDAHSLAFLDAHLDDASADPVAVMADPALRVLSILVGGQALTQSGPLPRIAAGLLVQLEACLQHQPGLSRREARRAQLRAAAAAGDLAAMLDLLANPQQRMHDEAARHEATREMLAIEAALVRQQQNSTSRVEESLRAARDTASAAGLVCVMASLLFELLR